MGPALRSICTLYRLKNDRRFNISLPHSKSRKAPHRQVMASRAAETNRDVFAEGDDKAAALLHTWRVATAKRASQKLTKKARQCVRAYHNGVSRDAAAVPIPAAA